EEVSAGNGAVTHIKGRRPRRADHAAHIPHVTPERTRVRDAPRVERDRIVEASPTPEPVHQRGFDAFRARGPHRRAVHEGTMPRALRSLRTVPGVDGVDAADDLLAEAGARGMSGWDFTWLDGRMTSDGLPWDYAALVERL